MNDQEAGVLQQATVKDQTASCGCRRILDRQQGVDNWLVREWYPCPDHAGDNRLAMMWT